MILKYLETCVTEGGRKRLSDPEISRDMRDRRRKKEIE